MNYIEKLLSKTLGQITKGYAYDTPLGAFPLVQVLGAPALGDVDTVVASTELSTTEETEITGNDITQPDVPRVLQVTGEEAGTVGTIKVWGKGISGQAIYEEFILDEATPVIGTLVFASVDKVVLPMAEEADHNVSVGTTDKLGLQRPIRAGTDIVKLTVDGVADTVASSSADGINASWLTPTTALNGTKEFVVYFNTYLL